MLLNKVLFVSLLVLGLCFLPALGERLQTRIAGGTKANLGQFPFVVLIQYPYLDTDGVTTLTYQATGFIYNPDIIVTTGNAMAKCADGQTATVSQNVIDVNNLAGAQIITFVCNLGTTIIRPAGWTAGVWNNDLTYIQLPSSFTGNVAIRLATSSPTSADNGRLFAVGYGESVPGAGPSPTLLYVPLNPLRNRPCYELLVAQNLSLVAPDGSAANFSFSENFCVKGFEKSPVSGVLTDVCVLDAGAPLIRTQNIADPYADHEVIGVINFGSCSATTPGIATYLFKYLNSTIPTVALPLPDQTAPPADPTIENPRKNDGNFACGDGIIQGGAYEKCDPPSLDIDTRNDPSHCCDPWTCQHKVVGTACTINNRNGTRCQSQPRCSLKGHCRVKFRRQGKSCNGPNTRCNRGRCCTVPGLTGCFV